MSFLNSLAAWFKAIFKAIFKFVTKLLKQLWPLILIIAVIYFAPVIGVWLTSVGAPAWLSSSFVWIGANITPLLTSAISSVWSGTAAVAGNAWTAFKAAELTTQLMVLGATAALIAPDETAALISDAVKTVGGVVTDVASNVAGSILTMDFLGVPLWGWAVGGIAFYLLTRKREPTETVVVGDSAAVYGDGGLV